MSRRRFSGLPETWLLRLRLRKPRHPLADWESLGATPKRSLSRLGVLDGRQILDVLGAGPAMVAANAAATAPDIVYRANSACNAPLDFARG